MGDDAKPSRRSLADGDIVSAPRATRRDVLTLAGAAAFTAVVAAEPASAQTSDNDSGPKADPAGRGRRRQTGQSDSDSGPNADRPGYGRPRTGASDSDPNDAAGRGRSSNRRTGNSDSDSGPHGDRAGYGRPRTGLSDSDPNDAAGRGRGRTGVSDSDPNDPAGRGRGR